MITLAGRDYGTAAEIAHALGGDVTEAMVRNWGQRDGLRRHRAGTAVYYPLRQAALRPPNGPRHADGRGEFPPQSRTRSRSQSSAARCRTGGSGRRGAPPAAASTSTALTG